MNLATETENTPDTENDFDASFDEFAAEREGSGGAEQETVVEEEADEAREEEQAEAETTSEQSADGEGKTEEEGPSLEEVLAERDRYKQMVSSDKGRVSGMQKTINELRAQLAEREKGKRDSELAGAEDDPEVLKAFSEDYPEIADAVRRQMREELAREREALRTELKASLDPLLQAEASRADSAAQEFTNEQSTAVEEVHEGWQTTVKSSEFADWFGKQSPGVQGLGASDYAADAILLLDRFKADTAPHESERDNGSGGASEADAIAQRRAAKKRSATSLQPSRIANRQEAAEDFDRAFDEFARKQDARLLHR